MQNQNDYATRERGGIPLHDYTRGEKLPRRFPITIDQVAHGLTIASLGLGMMELIMPGRMQKLAGVRKGKHNWLIRFAGLREIGHGLLIFASPRPLTGVWSRVAGDAMDLGLLGAAFSTPRVKKNRLIRTTAIIAGITAIDVLVAVLLGRKRQAEKGISAMTQEDLEGRVQGGGFRVLRSITIQRSPEELYAFWHNFTNLPQFMYHLEDVQVMDDRRSHWVAKAPAGTKVEWDAEITEDRPNELIAWQSTDQASVPNSGEVRFERAPADRGTVVHVRIEYRPPGGVIGRIVSMLFGEEPGQSVKGDLRRFKELMETGEVIRSDGSPEGRGQHMQLPARPMPEDKYNKVKDKYGQPAREPAIERRTVRDF